MTFPRSLADTPTAGDPARYPGVVTDGIRQVDYSERLKVGYRWYEAAHQHRAAGRYGGRSGVRDAAHLGR